MILTSKYQKLIEQISVLVRRFLKQVRKIEDNLEKKPFFYNARKKVDELHSFLGKNFWRMAEAVFVTFVLYVLFYGFLWKAPKPFPDHILVTIEKGEHLNEIADKMQSQNVVKSSLWLKIFTIMRGGEKKVIAGDYYMPSSKNIFDVSRMITRGEFGLSQIRIVIPEGLNSMEIVELLGANLPRFDKEEFIDKAKEYEGFLFPDTYFFMPNVKPEEVIAVMRENFARQVNDLVPDMEKFGKSLDEIVIMASIVEDEARQIETKRIVAGILWKRLRLDIPLQADATFKYHNGKTSFDLTTEDLEDDRNPYNTYANKGLPPSPISNPGIDSLRATVAPTNTDYLFFLSDKNGNMHYAVDFKGHKLNRELYLR